MEWIVVTQRVKWDRLIPSIGTLSQKLLRRILKQHLPRARKSTTKTFSEIQLWSITIIFRHLAKRFIRIGNVVPGTSSRRSSSISTTQHTKFDTVMPSMAVKSEDGVDMVVDTKIEQVTKTDLEDGTTIIAAKIDEIVETKKVKPEIKPKPERIIRTQLHPLASPQTFRGRLGYACLNTVLRAQQPSIFCSRTCRLDTLEKEGIGHVHGLALQNVQNILPMLKWNEEHGIRFMRLSSEMFPFASHPTVGYRVEDVPGVVEVLEETGREAARMGHRLTMHPGQYCQIASPTAKVVTNAISDLTYHTSILDIMKAPADSVLIMHMGGVFGDKEATLLRFRENWARIPAHIQRRIVLENDEICYSVDDLLPICEDLQIPLILDWHHDDILPSANPPETYLPRINAIWHARGIKPKQHYSESREGAMTPMQRRGHSDRVEFFPPCGDDMDLMIEAKDKEQAVFHLMRKYNLNPSLPEIYPVSLEQQLDLNKKAKYTRKVKPLIVTTDADGNQVTTTVRKPRKRKAKVEDESEEDDDLPLSERQAKLEAGEVVSPPKKKAKAVPKKKAPAKKKKKTKAAESEEEEEAVFSSEEDHDVELDLPDDNDDGAASPEEVIAPKSKRQPRRNTQAVSADPASLTPPADTKPKRSRAPRKAKVTIAEPEVDGENGADLEVDAPPSPLPKRKRARRAAKK
ncbi:UV-endonuclease UvdE-domain-containing protein [Phlyctochytrium arcticum]|nr:UV-endonuclease UvdE-domain-containing protein [Phlyctochytrium arcticum]